MPLRILIVFSTTHGQTRKIAETIAAQLRRGGHDVDVHDAALAPAAGEYEAVMLGSHVMFWRFSSHMARYIKRHRSALQNRCTAFFAVSMAPASRDSRAAARLQELMDGFWNRVAWTPAHVASFAGAVAFTQYGWLTRFIMKQINAAEGRPTDTSRDHEYTDWDAVSRFTDRFAQDFERRPRPPQPDAGPVWLGPLQPVR